MKKKILAGVLACILLIGVGIGGTLAWLNDTSEVVTNTFTYGNIDITLAETTGEDYEMIPGETTDKDPKVTVVAGSEDCYLFIKVQEVNNGTADAKYIDFEIDSDNWIPLAGYAGIYYHSEPVSAGEFLYILEGNSVTANGENVTKGYVDDLTEANYPQLIFTAAAVQSENLKDDAGNAVTTAAGAAAFLPEGFLA